ncbi:MAG: hypothetical protein LUQ46_01075 [Candidatus Methanomethyliaceae archaeon]|nr:hypothetical protein [Candidatus Methanomethyliaceae archaeon]
MVLLNSIPIRISFQGLESRGELLRILAPRTVESLVGVMPFTSKSFLWKEEVYFETPISMGLEKPRAAVQPGDLAYWPPGKAFCIFFGKSQPYSPVNVIGRITSDLQALGTVRKGEWVKVRLAD